MTDSCVVQASARLVSVARDLGATLFFAAVTSLASCSAGDLSIKFYVVVEPSQTARFIAAVTAIAKQNGMETAVSKNASDSGKVMTVVEGRGPGVELWLQSMPLSGQEDPHLCGIHTESYPDPAQYVVSTEPRFFGSQAKARETGERLLSQIQKSGFEVRRAPAVCGAAALRDR